MGTVQRPSEAATETAGREVQLYVGGDFDSDDASTDSEDLVTDSVMTAPPAESDRQDIVPAFGDVNVNYSRNVQIGNNTFYQGPVVINKVLKICDVEASTSGNNVPQIKDSGTTSDFHKVTDRENGSGGLKADRPQIKTTKLDNGVFLITNNEAGLRESELSKGIKCLQNVSRLHRLVILISSAIILVTITLLTILLIAQNRTTSYAYDDQDDNKLRIISRLEWVAQPAVQTIPKLNPPVPYVIFLQTDTEPCSEQSECVKRCRIIQQIDVESKNRSDIGYNYLVGADGFAYYGRGWYKEGAHTLNYNARSIGIAFIGTFDSVEPPLPQVTAAKKLIGKAEQMGLLTNDYKILTDSQLPGSNNQPNMLTEVIKTWPHWSQNP